MLLVGRKKEREGKKERNGQQVVFPRARYTLPAVLHGIFVTVKFN
jgi:hypothetical protein